MFEKSYLTAIIDDNFKVIDNCLWKSDTQNRYIQGDTMDPSYGYDTDGSIHIMWLPFDKD
jgi:hypothetical protein